MTDVKSMEITSANTASGSYETVGSSNVADAFLIGDKVETGKFPTNTLDTAYTVTEGS